MNKEQVYDRWVALWEDSCSLGTYLSLALCSLIYRQVIYCSCLLSTVMLDVGDAFWQLRQKLKKKLHIFNKTLLEVAFLGSLFFFCTVSPRWWITVGISISLYFFFSISPWWRILDNFRGGCSRKATKRTQW